MDEYDIEIYIRGGDYGNSVFPMHVMLLKQSERDMISDLIDINSDEDRKKCAEEIAAWIADTSIHSGIRRTVSMNGRLAFFDARPPEKNDKPNKVVKILHRGELPFPLYIVGIANFPESSQKQNPSVIIEVIPKKSRYQISVEPFELIEGNTMIE